MKRILTIFLLLLSVGSFAQKRSEVLKIYNWDNMINNKDISLFEQWYQEQTGEKVKIIYQTFESDVLAVNSIKMAHDDWDIIVVSSNYIFDMIRNGYIQKIDTSLFAATGTPNHISKISPFLKEQIRRSRPDDAIEPNDYFVPITYVGAGFFYNKDVYSKDEVSTWSVFHDKKFKNAILTSPDPVDFHLSATFAMNADSLLSGSMTPEDVLKKTSKEDLDRSEQWFMEAKEQICGWDASFGYEYIARGKVDIFYCWTSMYQVIRKVEKEIGRNSIDFAYPREGGFSYISGMVIPKYSGNSKAATYWLNFCMDPQVMARWLKDCYNTATVSDSLVFEAIQDKDLYPEETDLSYLFPTVPQAAHSHSTRIVYPPEEIACKQVVVPDTQPFIDSALLALNRVMCPKATLKEFWPEVLLILALLIYGMIFFFESRLK